MDVKKLFLDHFEKLALLIGGAILAAFVGSTVLKAQPADKAKDDVSKANVKIQAKADIASRNAPRPEAVNAAREVQLALDAAAEKSQKLPSWLFHKRPVLEKTTVGIEIPEPKHFAPTVEQPKGDLGRIGLRWSEHSSNHLVKIDKYEVYRAEGEAKPESFKRVATCEATAPNYTDTDVKPKTDYFYYVLSHASVDGSATPVKNARAKGAEVDLPPEMRSLQSTIMGPIRTKADVLLKLFSVTLKTTAADIRAGKPPSDATAYFKVFKYFPERKQWFDKSYSQVKVDEMIGTVEVAGAEKQDFTTDYKLLETKRVMIKRKVGGGAEIEDEADVAVVQDTKTGQTIEVSNKDVSPEVQEVGKNPRPGEESGESEKPAKPEKPEKPEKPDKGGKKPK